MRLEWTIAAVTKDGDEAPPRKLRGKYGHIPQLRSHTHQPNESPVLHLADTTSANTIRPVNRKLINKE